MNFVRKMGWRLIVAILLTGWATLFLPVNLSLWTFSNIAETSLVSSLVFGLIVGFLLKRFRWIEHIDTWIHEFGHAAVGTFFGGVPESIKLNRDTSGVTSSRFRKLTRFKSIFISAAGPLATVVSLYLCIRLAAKGLSFVILPILAVIVLIVLISTVRSAWGWLVGILVWAGITFSFAASQFPVFGFFNSSAKEIFLGAILGAASGVALRASISRLRMHGGDGDEGNIAHHLRVPEILVDLTILVMHVAIIWSTLSFLNVVPRVSELVSSSPEFQIKFQEITTWIQSLPIWKK